MGFAIPFNIVRIPGFLPSCRWINIKNEILYYSGWRSKPIDYAHISRVCWEVLISSRDAFHTIRFWVHHFRSASDAKPDILFSLLYKIADAVGKFAFVFLPVAQSLFVVTRIFAAKTIRRRPAGNTSRPSLEAPSNSSTSLFHQMLCAWLPVAEQCKLPCAIQHSIPWPKGCVCGLACPLPLPE